jgi:hypothetical protein
MNNPETQAINNDSEINTLAGLVTTKCAIKYLPIFENTA